MKKSFTWLFSLVMFLGLFCLSTGVVGQVAPDAETLGVATKVWPQGADAYTKITDKAYVVYPEDVVASTGAIRLEDDNGLVAVINATDSRVTITGDTVWVDLSAELEEYTAYEVTVDKTAFKAADGTPADYTGETSATNWGWMTGDYTAPTLTDVVPEDGTLYDSEFLELNLTFDDLTDITAGEGNIYVYKADGNIWDLVELDFVGTDANASIVGSVLKVDGIRQLQDTENYYVTVGAGVVTDEGLNADDEPIPYAGLTDITAWTFGTKDFTAPVWASGYPKKSNVENDSFDVLVKVNEDGTAYGVVSSTTLTANGVRNHADVVEVDVVGGVEATLSFDGLDELTEYTAYIVVDNADNDDHEVVETVTATTTETSAPKLATTGGVKYVKGTTETVVNVSAAGVVEITSNINQKIDKFVLTFTDENNDNEIIEVAEGNVVIRRVVDHSNYMVIPAEDITAEGSVVTIPLSGDLANDSAYYVIVPGTLFVDEFGNKFAGITTTTGWKFSTNDVITPEFTIIPAEGTANVDKNKNIVIKFNEVVQAVSGYSLTAGSGTNSPFEVQVNETSVAYPAPTINNNGGAYTTVTINPTNNFDSKSIVTVIIKADAITDGSNLIDTKQGISFLVEDYEGPVIDEWYNIPDQPGENIVIKFDEPIFLLGGTEITDDNLYSILTLKKNDLNGANVSATWTIDDAKKVITITPATPWTSEATYYVAVSSDIEDMWGNAYDDTDPTLRKKTFSIPDKDPQSVTFKSGDEDLGTEKIDPTASIVINFKDGSIDEPVSKWRYGNEWVDNSYADMTELLAHIKKVFVLKEGDASGANVEIASVTTMSNYQFTITADLASNKTYYFGIGASAKDDNGNVNAAKYVTFSTTFEGAPTLVSSTIEDGDKEVPKNEDVILTFNTDIKLAAQFDYDIAFDVNEDDPATTTDNQPGIYFVKDDATKLFVAYTDLVVDGNTLKIKHSDFSTDAVYDLVVMSDMVINKNSSATFDGIAENALEFETVDTKVAVTGLSPDGADTPEIDDPLVITVGEEVLPGAGNLDIQLGATDGLFERIDAGSDQVVYDYNSGTDVTTITITPSSIFNYNTSYYVEVDGGFFVDKAGNGSDAIFGTSDDSGVGSWTFSTPDPAVVVSKIIPGNGTDKVGLTTNIVVEFNREIKAGTGSVGFIEFDGSTTYVEEFYGISSSNVTISGKTLTIEHPNKPFSEDVEVFLYLEAGSILPKTGTASGNVLVDATSTPSYSFYTYDHNPPVPTFAPVEMVDGEVVYHPVSSTVSITFDEAIYLVDDPGTPVSTAHCASDYGIFTLYNVTASADVDFAGSISGNVVTLVPSANLDEASEYEIRIADDKIADDQGHALIEGSPAYTASTFYTVDETAPVVAVTLAGDEGAVILSDISTADANPKYFYYWWAPKADAANPSKADIMENGIRKSVDANGDYVDASTTPVNIITISDLMADTEYEVFFVAKDDFGNVSAVAKKAVETDDTVAPLFVSSDPVNGSVDVEIEDEATDNFKIELAFNEDVQLISGGTGSIFVKEVGTNTVINTLTQSALSDGTAGDELIDLTVPFDINKAPVNLYIEIGSGLIEDLAGNAFAGIFGSDTLNFTTEDNLVPTISKDFSGNPAVNADLKFKATENVQAGTGKATLYKGTVSIENAIEVFNATDVTINGKSIVINPTEDLEVETTYKVVFASGFVLDMSSNKNPNPEATHSFTTSSKAKPTVTTSPVASSAPVVKSALEAITVTFNENVFIEVGGLDKSLLILSQAEVKGQMTFVDGDGVAIPYTISGKTADEFVIDVAATDLDHLSSYTLTIGGFYDDDDMLMDDASFTWETTDGIAPLITFDPEDDEEDVAPTMSLTMKFSEQIYRETQIINGEFFYVPIDNDNVDAMVYLIDGDDNLVAFDATFNGVDLITIVPSAALTSSEDYTYGLIPGEGTVTAATVSDKDGNVVTGGDEDTWATFTVADVVEPALTNVTEDNFSPLGTGVSATEDMWVKFSEEIEVSTGSVVIRYEDGTIFQTVSGADLWVDEDYPTYLMIEHNNFEAYTTYFVELEEGVVVDGTGNPNAAYSDAENGWVFTTNDTFDLVAQASPQGDGQPSLVDLVLEFNKNNLVRNTSDYGYYLAVYKEDGSAVAQISVNDLVIVGNKVTYYNLELEEDQAYYARIEPNAIKDGSGNKFAGIMDDSWSFSTMASIAPNLVSTTPEDDNISVDPATSTFTMTFDRDIALGTGMISVRYSSDGSVFEEIDVTTGTVEGSTITFELTQMMEENTAYYVLVSDSAITNTEVTADAFAGIDDTYTWNFTTGEEVIPPVVPELVEWTPQDTIADSHATFVMTFADTVMLATDSVGYLTVTEMDSTDATLTIEITADMVDGNVVTVDYDTLVGRLWTNTTYIVNVDGGILVNAEGNAFAGVNDDTTWTFTTGPVWATPTEPEIELVDFKMYPNPFTNHITIENSEKVARLIMVNIAGQRVMDVEYPSREISTGHLVNGVYVISLITEDGQRAKTARMIKR